ncbi:MAG TPA: ATP-binding protein [Opitutus sp.]|nr:ATP-binding protein [Opitutus sp.]
MKALHSIRWRLQLWHGLLLAGVLVGFGVTAYWFVASRQQREVDNELLRRATVLDGSLHPVRPPRPELPPPARRLELRRGDEELFGGEAGYYYVIWLHNGAPETRSGNAPAEVPRPLRQGGGERQRGAWREVILRPNPGDIILVGRSMARERGELARFAWLLTGAGAATLALGLLGGGWLAGRALRPVQDISAAAAKIAGGDLSQRIDTRDTDSELGELARVLNETFTRLEAAFARQTQFTADAAHELRTPVTVMLTQVQNALGTECPAEEHREAFEACQRAAQRMRRLIESLLQLARLDAGRQAQQRAEIDLAELATECVESLRPLAAERKVALHAEAGPARCTGDADRLLQVVANLVSNAIHHNRAGGNVWVSTSAAGGFAQIVVSDDGPGIAGEHLPHVFERFYRADKARSGAAGHTGLGLAIAKGIVEAHGGTITARSESGAGATFSVQLPVRG